jgi:sterol desaturase/sphingolipid hydroxylase (fatty acid hydroxylase superfamily)
MRAAWAAAPRMTHARQIDAIPSFVRTAWNGWREAVLDPYYWLFLAGLSVLQLFWPAARDHRLPNRALAEDAMWFVFSTVLVVTLLGACLAPLNLAYEHLAGGRGLNLTPRFGVWGVAIFALLIADLLAWYSHWLHHHVPSLWYFHAVHHSQTNLNVLSDNRTHFIETFVSAVVAYAPARILGLSSPDAIKLTSLTIFVSAVIHTNIRTNLGPLRNVFVSPQAHRVHHSISVEHFNTNYGTVFMFWDLLFRTRSEDVNAYPATGIDDITFPHGQSANPASLVATWAKQFAHPFRLVLQRDTGYAGNVSQRHTTTASPIVLTPVAMPTASDLLLGLEEHVRLRALTRAAAVGAVEKAQEPVADRAGDLSPVLERVTDVCAKVKEQIEVDLLERRELADAIALLTRPDATPREVPREMIPDVEVSIIEDDEPELDLVATELADEADRDRTDHGGGVRTSVKHAYKVVRSWSSVIEQARHNYFIKV